MREFQINLRSVQEVRAFVGLATTMPFTVLVADDHHRVNGKSFMELFCLDLTHPLVISVECGDAEFEGLLAAAEPFLSDK